MPLLHIILPTFFLLQCKIALRTFPSMRHCHMIPKYSFCFTTESHYWHFRQCVIFTWFQKYSFTTKPHYWHFRQCIIFIWFRNYSFCLTTKSHYGHFRRWLMRHLYMILKTLFLFHNKVTLRIFPSMHHLPMISKKLFLFHNKVTLLTFPSMHHLYMIPKKIFLSHHKIAFSTMNMFEQNW